MLTVLTADDALAAHRVHLILLLGGWALALAGASAWTRLTARGDRAGREVLRHRVAKVQAALPGLGSATLTAVAAATSVGAVVHLAVTPEHFEESTLYGVFFACLGLLQLAWSVLLLARPSGRLLRLGGVVSAVVVVLWLETRFVGAGIGPLRAGREALGLPDLVSTATELLLVVVALRNAASSAGADALDRPAGRPATAG